MKKFKNWKKRWRKRLEFGDRSFEKKLTMMRSFNPLVIPRNGKVEESLKAANCGDFTPINQLLNILSKPYTKQKNITD